MEDVDAVKMIESACVCLLQRRRDGIINKGTHAPQSAWRDLEQACKYNTRKLGEIYIYILG